MTVCNSLRLPALLGGCDEHRCRPALSSSERKGFLPVVWAMLAEGCCWCGVCPALPRKPASTSNSLRSGWLGPGRSHELKMATRPRLRSITTALLTQASVEDLSNNQVLLAVVTTSLVGQILKPFTSALQGKGFNWRLVVASGGMPSTHSACVTAACTSIALERGLADSLFGLSVVFAGIVMYDAQGVRRAVGKQAEVLNTVMLGSGSNLFAASNKQPSAPSGQQLSELQSLQGLMAPRVSSSQKRKSSIMCSATDEQSDNPGENSQLVDINDVVFSGGPYTRSEKFIEVAKDLPSVEAGQVNLQEIGDLDGWRHIPLKESVGHTKLEVLVGGLWGVFSTLALSYFVKTILVETLHS